MNELTSELQSLIDGALGRLAESGDGTPAAVSRSDLAGLVVGFKGLSLILSDCAARQAAPPADLLVKLRVAESLLDELSIQLLTG